VVNPTPLSVTSGQSVESRRLETSERLALWLVLLLGPLSPWLAGAVLKASLERSGAATLPWSFFLGNAVFAEFLYALFLLVPFVLFVKWAIKQLSAVALTPAEVFERRVVILCGFVGGMLGGLGCLLSLFKRDDLLLGRFVLYDRMAFSWIAPFFVGPVWLVGVAISIIVGVLVGRGLVLLGRAARP